MALSPDQALAEVTGTNLVTRGEDFRPAVEEAAATGRLVQLQGRLVLPGPVVPTMPDGSLPLHDVVVTGGPDVIVTSDDPQRFTYGGLLGHWRQGGDQPTLGRMDVYGVHFDGGRRTGQPTFQHSNIISLAHPYQSAWNGGGPWTGITHRFFDCTTSDPWGFTVQPANGVEFVRHLFLRCGQPDLSHDVNNFGNHFDIVGSGHWGYAVLTDSHFQGCSGNRVDLESGVVGKPSRLRMVNCGDIGQHQLGGIYGLCDGSQIIGGRFRNRLRGSGIAYDAASALVNRRNNVVRGVDLTNMTINVDTSRGDVQEFNTIRNA
jgi:hypothetical protein